MGRWQEISPDGKALGGMKMAQKIIALSGPRACGKSTIAKHLVSQHGYTRIAFADALRDVTSIGNSERMNDRLYLSCLGEKLRELLPDFLLQVLQHRLESIDGHIVIEDIRFPTEVDFCHMLGAMSVRLEIPVETQRKRLASRDGKLGVEADLLINCEDENALGMVEDWGYVIPAVGDFRKLASKLDMLALKVK